MEYRQLGRSDLKVSAVGLGAMTFGAQTPEEDAFRQLDMAYDAGITLFDTAENYPAPVNPETQGRSEEILGRWITERSLRNAVVIATKVAGPGNGPGDMTHIRGPERRLDRPNIRAAVDASLRRLGTDRIDLYQVHWPERPVTTLRRTRYSRLPDEPNFAPIEETLGALAEQVEAGKVRYIGICNESPWGTMRYLALSEQGGLPRIASIQNSYSLIDRLFELGLAEIVVREQLAMIAYSPLASGVLTGKYLEAPEPQPGSRSSIFAGFETRLTPGVLTAAKAYAEIGHRYGIDPAHLALSFARQRPFVTSVLVAASRPEQLAHNLKSLDVSLPRDILKEIDAVHDANPYPK